MTSDRPPSGEVPAGQRCASASLSDRRECGYLVDSWLPWTPKTTRSAGSWSSTTGTTRTVRAPAECWSPRSTVAGSGRRTCNAATSRWTGAGRPTRVRPQGDGLRCRIPDRVTWPGSRGPRRETDDPARGLGRARPGGQRAAGQHGGVPRRALTPCTPRDRPHRRCVPTVPRALRRNRDALRGPARPPRRRPRRRRSHRGHLPGLDEGRPRRRRSAAVAGGAVPGRVARRCTPARPVLPVPRRRRTTAALLAGVAHGRRDAGGRNPRCVDGRATDQRGRVGRRAADRAVRGGTSARRRSVRLLEPGASAGLNLNVDRYRFTGPGWSAGPAGSPLQLDTLADGVRPERVTIVERRGCDLAPVDRAAGDGALRLRSFVWPWQLDRHARLVAALAIVREHPVAVDRACAADWLAGPAGRTGWPDMLTVVWHSVTRQYWPAAETAGSARSSTAARHRMPLAHVSMEDSPTRSGQRLRGRVRRPRDARGRRADRPLPLPRTAGRADCRRAGRTDSGAGRSPEGADRVAE